MIPKKNREPNNRTEKISLVSSFKICMINFKFQKLNNLFQQISFKGNLTAHSYTAHNIGLEAQKQQNATWMEWNDLEGKRAFRTWHYWVRFIISEQDLREHDSPRALGTIARTARLRLLHLLSRTRICDYQEVWELTKQKGEENVTPKESSVCLLKRQKTASSEIDKLILRCSGTSNTD